VSFGSQSILANKKIIGSISSILGISFTENPHSPYNYFSIFLFFENNQLNIPKYPRDKNPSIQHLFLNQKTFIRVP
jgi:hypothetical protein